VDALLFSEGTSRILLSVAKEHAEELESLAGNQRVALSRLGITGGDQLRVQINGVDAMSFELSELRDGWWSSIERDMQP
jgi:phosphoribosylformylglycinamidine synthase